MEKVESKVSLWAFPQTKPDEGEANALLFDNVQFIYELALAELELQALGAKFQVTNGLRHFQLLECPDPDILRRRVAYFKAVNGEFTDYFHIVRANRTRSVNQYLTHWIYPYKGKFHPQMIRALLNIIKVAPGDTILDPFLGSGTAAVEAQLLGVNCVGIDISPLSVLQSRVKSKSLDVLPQIEETKAWILEELNQRLMTRVESIVAELVDSIANEPVRNFFKVAELIAHSDKTRRKKEFLTSFVRNVQLMSQSVADYKSIAAKLGLRLGEIKIYGGDARDLPVTPESIDGIITSPPYSIALDYVANDAHALRALGCDVEFAREKFIGVRGRGPGKIKLYNRDMEQCLAEMARVLKKDRFCVIVIGNASYLGEEIPTVEFTIEKCQSRGLRLVRNIDKIIYGLYNVMKRENILIFHKG